MILPDKSRCGWQARAYRERTIRWSTVSVPMVNRHIARWRSVKHVTTFVEEDGDAEIIHHRERWTNELRLVYADGRVLKLAEIAAKKEDEANGECAPSTRAA